MRTADFDYELPPELIAQTPAASRDASRLLVLHRDSGRIEHRQFRDLLHYLRAGDVLALNDSRVLPARLRLRKAQTGGRFKILLLEENERNDWWCLVHPAKRAQAGLQLIVDDLQGRPSGVCAVVLDKNVQGHCRFQFSGTSNIAEALEQFGEVPLPPYIRRTESPTEADKHRYQTVFARETGSVAAPTAGLHFSEDLLAAIRAKGVDLCFVTLHVGLGTFAPVKTETIEAHTMHEERYEVSEQTAFAINAARASRRRIVAVGTTTVRVLETVAAANDGGLQPGAGRTRIFIHPPARFQVVNAMLTNFHLPRSTLLMLVSAFTAPGELHGSELIRSAYAEAIRERYRFFSYGDAMLIV